jgi:hypothetical protein
MNFQTSILTPHILNPKTLALYVVVVFTDIFQAIEQDAHTINTYHYASGTYRTPSHNLATHHLFTVRCFIIGGINF